MCFLNISGTKNHVILTAMLTGYSQNGYGNKAIECFRYMHSKGIKCNEFTFPSVLTACSTVQAFDFGQQVHDLLIKGRLGDNIYVQTALLDMYAKCGNLNGARCILHSLRIDNVTAWNSMIVSCVREGSNEEAM